MCIFVPQINGEYTPTCRIKFQLASKFEMFRACSYEHVKKRLGNPSRLSLTRQIFPIRVSVVSSLPKALSDSKMK